MCDTCLFYIYLDWNENVAFLCYKSVGKRIWIWHERCLKEICKLFVLFSGIVLPRYGLAKYENVRKRVRKKI